MELELSINPFMRTESEEVKNYAEQHGADSNDFRVLRVKKISFNL